MGIEQKSSVATAFKQFDIWQSQRSYRFKEEAFANHAPQTPGIYELVTFDDQQNAKVLFAGCSTDKSIYECLYEHWRSEREPDAQKLLAEYPNLYFSYIVEHDAKTPEDLQDLFWGLCQQDKPALMDWAKVPNSGRYSAVMVKEKSLL